MENPIILMVRPDCTLAPLPGDWPDALRYLVNARALGLPVDDMEEDLCDRYGWRAVDLEDLPDGVAAIVDTP